MTNPESNEDDETRPKTQSIGAGFQLLKYLGELPPSARLSAFIIAAFLGIFGYIVATADADERKIALLGLLAIIILSVVFTYRLMGANPNFENKLVLDAPMKGAEGGREINYAFDLFVAVPMAALANDEERLRVREAVIQAIAVIQRRCSFDKIFYAGYKADIERNFDPPALGLKHNVPRIRASKRFMLVYPRAVPTGALVELGMALGLGKPTVLFIQEGVDPPYLIREASAGHEIKDFPIIRTYFYDGPDHLVKLIEDHGPELFGMSSET